MAGIQIFGSHGLFQIDGTYRNLALRSKLTVNTTSSLGASLGSVTDVLNLPTGTTTPVIAVRGGTNAATVYWLNVGTGQYQVMTNAPVGTSLTIYLFAESAPSTSGSGLRVFDASGAVVFDSMQKYMRVAGIVVSSALGQSIALPSGRAYALAVTGGFYSNAVAVPVSQYQNYQLRYAGRMPNATTAELFGVALHVSVSANPATSTTANNACLLAIDVTDY